MPRKAITLSFPAHVTALKRKQAALKNRLRTGRWVLRWKQTDNSGSEKLRNGRSHGRECHKKQCSEKRCVTRSKQQRVACSRSGLHYYVRMTVTLALVTRAKSGNQKSGITRRLASPRVPFTRLVENDTNLVKIRDMRLMRVRELKLPTVHSCNSLVMPGFW